jgi:hypothetical protein
VYDNYKGYSRTSYGCATPYEHGCHSVCSRFSRSGTSQPFERLPVTNDDINTDHAIFGPNLASIRGKTVWRKPTRVVTDYVAISWALINIHSQVTVAVDVMFVNKVPFLVSVLCNINLLTIEHAPQRNATKLVSLIQWIIQIYARAGLTIQTLLMDTKFEKVRNHNPMLNFNTTAADEHVGKIEHSIQVIKERACGIVCTLPYPCLPHQMLIHLIHFMVMWLNNFPVVNGIFADFSSQELILWHCEEIRP